MSACIVKCPYCGKMTPSSVTNGNIACTGCHSRIIVRNGKAIKK